MRGNKGVGLVSLEDNCESILSAVSGIKGWIAAETVLRANRRFMITAASSSALLSFARAQGLASSIYLFASPITSHIFESAVTKSNCGIVFFSSPVSAFVLAL